AIRYVSCLPRVHLVPWRTPGSWWQPGSAGALPASRTDHQAVGSAGTSSVLEGRSGARQGCTPCGREVGEYRAPLGGAPPNVKAARTPATVMRAVFAPGGPARGRVVGRRVTGWWAGA